MNTVTAELVDGCQLHCELCWNRNRTPSGEQMSLETVAKVLAKYGKRRIDWFNWGEPLLHRQFVEVAKMVHGTHSRVSTNLSLPVSDEVIDALQFFRLVIVSLSGMSTDIYEIYHHGGNFELVMCNLRKLSGRNLNVAVRWLQHKRNAHQIEACQAFCRDSKFVFHSQSLNCEVEDLVNGFEHELLQGVHSSGRYCRLLDSVVIGVDGRYLLCCASHNVPTGYTIDDDITLEQLVAAKSKLPLCHTCCERQLWKMF